MTIQVFPEPTTATTSKYAISITISGSVYSAIPEADDFPLDSGTNARFTKFALTTPTTITPGTYIINSSRTTSNCGISIGDTPIRVASTGNYVVLNTTSSAITGFNQIRWPQVANPFASTGIIGNPAYENNVILLPFTWNDASLPANSGRVYISTNGNSYTTSNAGITQSISNQNAFAAGYVNGRYLVSGYTGYINYSTDLVNWTTGSVVTGTNTSGVICFAYNGSNRTTGISGNNGTYYTSTNGVNWTTGQGSLGQVARKIRYVNNRFIAMGESRTYAISTNGTSWTSYTPAVIPSTDALNDVAYGNNRYVLVSEFGNAFMSTDGVNWTTATDGSLYGGYSTTTSNINFYSAAFNNGRFIAAGKNVQNTGGGSAKMYTSTDGLNWVDLGITVLATYTSAAQTSFVMIRSLTIPSTDALGNSYRWIFLGSADGAGNNSQAPVQPSSPNLATFSHYGSRLIKGSTISSLSSYTVEKISDLNLVATTSGFPD